MTSDSVFFSGTVPLILRYCYSLLPQGVSTIYIEIFDECSFTMDELIAWTRITIPGNVLKGETYEDWFPLSGTQGEGLEGMINLVLSYSPVSMVSFEGEKKVKERFFYKKKNFSI